MFARFRPSSTEKEHKTRDDTSIRIAIRLRSREYKKSIEFYEESKRQRIIFGKKVMVLDLFL